MSTIRERALAEAAALCRVQVRRPPGYGGQWEGYGESMGDKTGPECAAEIEALAKDDPEEGMNKPKLYEWTVANANGDCCTGITAGNMVEQMNRDAPDRGPWTFVSKVEVQEKPEGGVLREEHVNAVIEEGRRALVGEIPMATRGPLLATAKVHHLISSAIGETNAPKMPYSVEVESERTEVVKHYGVVRPDGAMGGTTYTDKDDAEEEVALLLEGFADGRASAMKRMEKLEADNNDLRSKLAAVQATAEANGASWERAEGNVKRLRAELFEIEEREAACCPEDTGFDEYIATLKKKIGVLRDAGIAVIAHEVLANPSHRWCAPNSKCVVCDLAAAFSRVDRGAGVVGRDRDRFALACMVAGAVWAEAAPDMPIDSKRCVAIVERVLAAQVQEVLP
jgi:hypothetical protein